MSFNLKNCLIIRENYSETRYIYHFTISGIILSARKDEVILSVIHQGCEDVFKRSWRSRPTGMTKNSSPKYIEQPSVPHLRFSDSYALRKKILDKENYVHNEKNK
jgi:hypothetical protein